MNHDKKHKNQVEKLKHAVTSQSIGPMPEADVMELIVSYFAPSAVSENVTQNMLDRFGTVACAMDADIEYLENTLGDAQAAEFFKLLPMFGTYYRLDKAVGGRYLGNLDDIIEYCTYRFSTEKREVLYMILLDNSLKMLACELISEGDVGGVYADTNKMAEVMFRYGASSYILVHNHPNGVAYPSEADIALTAKTTELFNPFNKNLIEHLIISKNNYFPIVQMMRNGVFLKTDESEYQISI